MYIEKLKLYIDEVKEELLADLSNKLSEDGIEPEEISISEAFQRYYYLHNQMNCINEISLVIKKYSN